MEEDFVLDDNFESGVKFEYENENQAMFSTFRFQSNWRRFPAIRVHKDSLSQTVPDMSFTPREIIQKFSRGEKVPLGFQALYDGDDDRPADPFLDDPTRDPNFDFGDYVEEKHSLEVREAERKQRSKGKKSLDAKRKASAEELSASDVMKRETTSEAAKVSPTVQQ